MLLEKSVSLVARATRGASWLCSLRNQLCLCVSVYPLSGAIDMQKSEWAHVRLGEMLAAHLI